MSYGKISQKQLEILEYGSLTPKIPESLIWLIFLHKFKLLVDRTAVLCYNS